MTPVGLRCFPVPQDVLSLTRLKSGSGSVWEDFADERPYGLVFAGGVLSSLTLRSSPFGFDAVASQGLNWGRCQII